MRVFVTGASSGLGEVIALEYARRAPGAVIGLAARLLAALEALAAIARGRRFAVIPWQMGWVARLLRVLPDALFDAAFARAPHTLRTPPL